MKLYATTTSERASKGQGGNEYLKIEITDADKNLLGIIQLSPKPDGSRHVLPVLQAYFDSRMVLVKSIDSEYRFQVNNTSYDPYALDGAADMQE